MSRSRILIILPSYDAGGAENYALRLIEHAGSARFEWHVTSGNLANRRLETAFASAGAGVHHASPGFGYPWQSLQFYRFLRQYRFDAVMSLNGVFGGVALGLSRIAGVPRRFAWHRRSTPAYAPTPMRRLYARASLGLLNWASTLILSNSRAALDQFYGPRWEHSLGFKMIPNGVDPERFKPRPELRSAIRARLGISDDALVIGHVGRVDPAKDHDTLFATVRILRQTRRDIRLLLVGTGTDSAKFLERLAGYGIDDIAHGLGVREDVHDLYQAMDVFLFSSITEGQPNALIEAMLSGIPIVATDIAPIREALPDFLHHRLFQARNARDAAAIIESLERSPSGQEEQARHWAAHQYDPERNFSAVLELLGA